MAETRKGGAVAEEPEEQGSGPEAAEPVDPTTVVAPPEGTGAPAPAGDLVAGGKSSSILYALSLPVLAILTALAIGALIIIATDQSSIDGLKHLFSSPGAALKASGLAVYNAYEALILGAFGSVSAASETLLVTTPLIFAGLSVALGFRAGLFNIGAEGQITAGAIAAAAVGFSFTGLPGPIHLALIAVAAFVGGAIWGTIPGLLKAKTGAHEVITTIMLNYIAIYLADYVLTTDFFRRPDRFDPISKPVTNFMPHLFGSSNRANLNILVALAVAAAVAWLINRTTIGFEFRAVGANPSAARAAGMSPGRTFVAVMATAGGIAGMAAFAQLTGPSPSLTPGFASGLGFEAIALALVGKAKPGGVVLAAFLFGILKAGSRNMQAVTATPVDIVTIIQALIIMFVAAPALVRAIYHIKARRVIGPETFTKGWGG
jgi:simple sugar transport system permease protein